MANIKIGSLYCEYRRNPVGIHESNPRLSWKIFSDFNNVIQNAYHIQVSHNDISFNDLVWDTGKVISNESLHVVYKGVPLESQTRYYVRVKIWDQNGNESEWSSLSYWEMGILNATEWKANWITPEQTNEVSYIRKPFNLKSSDKKVSRAKIYGTSLGLYSLYFNGNRVSNELFTPGWTSYHHRLQYQVYDVTNILNSGENVIGILLGDGWYKGYLGWHNQKNLYGDKRALLLQMHITFDDGTEEMVITDETWKSTTGPILTSQIYHGEIYDARLEMPGWSTNNFNDHDWKNVNNYNHSKDILIAQENVPTRIIQEIKPKNLIHTPSGDKVLDFGQNLVGWVSFSVSGQEGMEIKLQHSEVLDKDGNFFTDNLRTAKQTTCYITKGALSEFYEPLFTFQGFRYVKIEGYPGEILLSNFTAKVIHSDMRETGTFESGNEMINQLQSNIKWGMKGNFLDVPTDCPQRDERMGWTGDAQVFIRTAAFNMNVAPFFNKWLKDLEADQFPDGRVPHVVPDVLQSVDRGTSSSAWGDAAVICPWVIYLYYNDKRILEQQYISMKAWIDYIRVQGNDEFFWNTGWHYGDWLGLDAEEGSYIGATPKELVATAFYAYSTKLFTKIATILDNTEDSEFYEGLYKGIVERFNEEFIDPNGRLNANTQTAHVLTLMFGLAPEKKQSTIAKDLVTLIKNNNYHLQTGFVGTPYLCHVLTDYGYSDVAYKLLLQHEYPSWLYPITKGATTIWEHWDGIKSDGSFWSNDMNSFNHYAYGAIGDWLYRAVAGINYDEQNPGFNTFSISPIPHQDLGYVKASFNSMYGLINSMWEYLDDDRLLISVTIPPNTKAKVVLPFADGNSLAKKYSIVEKSNPQEVSNGFQIELPSGSYEFIYQITKGKV